MKRLIAAFLACLALSAGAADIIYAPYLDVMGSRTLPANGLKAITLAFLGTDGSCSVGWRGLHKRLPADTLADGTTVSSLIADLQKQGIEVILSFGGWLGADPAAHCDSPAALQAVYQLVLDRYPVKALDFDIEGPGVVEDRAAHDRRAQALLALKKTHPELTISFTLPVRPHGVPKGNGLEVLESARAAGYSPDLVNYMTMDYFFDPRPSTMERATERAMDNAARQMREMGLTSKLGVIPMIGQNDNASETFTLDDAKSLMAYVERHPDIVRLAMWSVARDNGSCVGNAKAQDSCSGVAQDAWAYSTIFSAVRYRPPF